MKIMNIFNPFYHISTMGTIVANSSYFIVRMTANNILIGDFYSQKGDYLTTVDCSTCEDKGPTSPDVRFTAMLDPATKDYAECTSIVFWVCPKTDDLKVSFYDRNNNVIACRHYDGALTKEAVAEEFTNKMSIIDFNHFVRAEIAITDNATPVTTSWKYLFRKWVGV